MGCRPVTSNAFGLLLWPIMAVFQSQPRIHVGFETETSIISNEAAGGWPIQTKLDTLADALKSLKQGVSRRLIGNAEHFRQVAHSSPVLA
jgi:hypothetical protein